MYKPLKVDAVDEAGLKRVRFDIGGESAMLGAQDIDALIDWLGKTRATMTPSPPMEPQKHQQYVVELDPCWYVEKNPLIDGIVLLLRHSGLGWAGFSMPQSSLEKLQLAMNRPAIASHRISQLAS